MNQPNKTNDCQPPENFPADYCFKLKSGIARLQNVLLTQYQATFPSQGEWVSQVLREAELAAWETPFPGLLFPALAHLKIHQASLTV